MFYRSLLLARLALVCGALLGTAVPVTGVTRVAPVVAAAALNVDGDAVTLGNGAITVRYDLRTGMMDLAWGSGIVVRNAHAAAELLTGGGPRPLRSTEMTRRIPAQERINGPLGRGVTLTVTGENTDLGAALTQSFTVLDGRPYALMRVSAGRLPGAAGGPVRTRQIEALAAGGITDPPGSVAVATTRDPRLYRMPFDNNGDITVLPAAGQAGAVSYWLTALFDVTGGAGLVAGATESRVWKSAAWYDGPSGSLSLFSGARAHADTADHAVRTGERVESAEFLVGGYADYRDGLGDVMRVTALREPPLPAPDLPPPLGWNPWYQYEFRANEDIMHGIAGFLAGEWVALGYRYVNLDAGWNVRDGDWRPNPERFPNGMAALAAGIHEHGLLAGSYFIPFAIHPEMMDKPIAGTPYLFREAVLRDAAGAPVRADILNWEYVLDGTHPGALAYLRNNAAMIAADGFDFIKLDFLHIGTQEGRHHDPTATAMEAFHRGMAAVREGVASAGRPVYLSAAIAPLYVHEYVHARRVGNDVNFGQAREAANVALSWFTDMLYHRNDPDNVVVRADWYPGYSDEMARMHATMAALGGTLFIVGDDPRYLSPERAALLTHPEVLALAREGVAARPLDVGETPAPVWAATLHDGGVAVGVFNWSDAPVRRTVPFAALGLDPVRPYHVRDLWTSDASGSATGAYTVELPPRTAALVRIE